MIKLIPLIVLLISPRLSAQDFSFSAMAGAVNHQFQISGEPGRVIEINGYLTIYRDIIVSISIGHRSWKEPYGTNGNSFTTVPLMAGFRAPFWDDIISPYFSAEIGFEVLKRSFTYQEYQQSQSGPYQVVFSEARNQSRTHFNSRIGLGSVIAISNTLGIDIAIKYSAISFEYDFVDNPSFPIRSSKRLFIYDFVAGIIYHFN